MAVTLRLRTTAYDNIASGSATGTERTISGDVPPAQVYGGADKIAVASTATWSTDTVQDNIAIAVPTLAGENI